MGPKLLYPDPHGHWFCYRDYLKCSVPMWSVGVICYEWTRVFSCMVCVFVFVCVWSLGVKKPQFLCLQVFRSAMCSFRQRVEQLVSHAYREFILISGVYLVFSCSQNVICLSGNYHFQKTKNKKTKKKKKWKTKTNIQFFSNFIQHPVLYSVFIYVFVELQQYWNLNVGTKKWTDIF